MEAHHSSSDDRPSFTTFWRKNNEDPSNKSLTFVQSDPGQSSKQGKKFPNATNNRELRPTHETLPCPLYNPTSTLFLLVALGSGDCVSRTWRGASFFCGTMPQSGHEDLSSRLVGHTEVTGPTSHGILRAAHPGRWVVFPPFGIIVTVVFASAVLLAAGGAVTVALLALEPCLRSHPASIMWYLLENRSHSPSDLTYQPRATQCIEIGT